MISRQRKKRRKKSPDCSLPTSKGQTDYFLIQGQTSWSLFVTRRSCFIMQMMVKKIKKTFTIQLISVTCNHATYQFELIRFSVHLILIDQHNLFGVFFFFFVHITINIDNQVVIFICCSQCPWHCPAQCLYCIMVEREIWALHLKTATTTNM